MPEEPTIETEEQPAAETEATEEEDAFSPEEQAEIDAWLAEEKGKWEAEFREQIREELLGELEAERVVAQWKADSEELAALKAQKPKLNPDENAKRGPGISPKDGVLKVTSAQLNDFAWMTENAGRIADAAAGAGFDIID
jgi:hypothetical protein